MPGSRLYNFTLKQPQFEVTPFQAVAFEPKEKENLSILTNAFEKIEERENKTAAAKSELNTMFSQLDSKLNKDDPETMEWWSNFQKKYKDELDDYVRLGDYSKALKFATEAAGEAANDKELLGRMNSSAMYKKVHDDALQRFNDGTVLDTSLEWFDTVQPYTHKNITDKNGNIISGTFEQKIALLDDVNWSSVYEGTMKLINPDTTSTSTSSGSRRSSSGPEGGHSKGSSSSRSHSKTIVTAKEINDMAQEIAKDTTLMPRVAQQYEKDKFRLMKLSNDYWSGELSDSDKASVKYEIDILKSRIFDKNGATDLEGYIKRCLQNEVISNGLAYENESTSTSHESDISNTKPSGSGGGGGGGSSAPIIINTGNQQPGQTPSVPTRPYNAPRITFGPGFGKTKFNGVELTGVQQSRDDMYNSWIR